jgi:hypothetical protein
MVFLRVLPAFAAIASVPIAITKANTARKENKCFNVFFIIIPLLLLTILSQKKFDLEYD